MLKFVKNFRAARMGFFFIAGSALLLVGCQTMQLSHYISPRITGRVVAADTHQPLADVRVSHVTPQSNDSDTPLHGGEIQEDETYALRTKADGTFTLDSERDLSFESDGWSVTISFSHPGYATLRTNFTPASVTRYSSDGEPLVQAGDILLHPLQQAQNNNPKP